MRLKVIGTLCAGTLPRLLYYTRRTVHRPVYTIEGPGEGFVLVVYLVVYRVVYSALDSDDSSCVVVGLRQDAGCATRDKNPAQPEMEKEGAIVDASDGEENNGRPQRQRNPPAKFRENEVIHVSTRAASVPRRSNQEAWLVAQRPMEEKRRMEKLETKTRRNRRCKSR